MMTLRLYCNDLHDIHVFCLCVSLAYGNPMGIRLVSTVAVPIFAICSVL